MQVMFRDKKVTEEIEWSKMVIIPKGRGGHRGIKIVKVLWNVCIIVVHCWLKMSVVLHDTINGLRKGEGRGQ